MVATLSRRRLNGVVGLMESDSCQSCGVGVKPLPRDSGGPRDTGRRDHIASLGQDTDRHRCGRGASLSCHVRAVPSTTPWSSEVGGRTVKASTCRPLAEQRKDPCHVPNGRRPNRRRLLLWRRKAPPKASFPLACSCASVPTTTPWRSPHTPTGTRTSTTSRSTSLLAQGDPEPPCGLAGAGPLHDRDPCCLQVAALEEATWALPSKP